MKDYGGVVVQIHIYLTSALFWDEGSASHPGHFTPGEKAPGTHWIGYRVGPRVALGAVRKRKVLTVQGLELRTLGRPAHSQSLYRLSYPGSQEEGVSLLTFWTARYSFLPPEERNIKRFRKAGPLQGWRDFLLPDDRSASTSKANNNKWCQPSCHYHLKSLKRYLFQESLLVIFQFLACIKFWARHKLY
jgi:hypothetical protein